jgi:hypothetical protein
MNERNDAIVCEAWDRRASAAIRVLGVNTWSELSEFNESELLKVGGLGRKTLAFIKDRMRERGVEFAGGRRVVFGPRLVPNEPVQGVYFVRAGEFVKIGFAKDVRHRYGFISQMCPHPCELIAVIPTKNENQSRDIERSLHARFKDYRHKLEWFRYTPEIESYAYEASRPRIQRP